MATKKTATKKTSASKGGAKASKKPRRVDFRTIRGGLVMEYADPIRAAVARGNVNELRKLATVARQQITEVQRVLQVLERNIAKAGGKK